MAYGEEIQELPAERGQPKKEKVLLFFGANVVIVLVAVFLFVAGWKQEKEELMFVATIIEYFSYFVLGNLLNWLGRKYQLLVLIFIPLIPLEHWLFRELSILTVTEGFFGSIVLYDPSATAFSLVLAGLGMFFGFLMKRLGDEKYAKKKRKESG